MFAFYRLYIKSYDALNLFENKIKILMNPKSIPNLKQKLSLKLKP